MSQSFSHLAPRHDHVEVFADRFGVVNDPGLHRSGLSILCVEVLNALRVRKHPVKWDVLCAHFDRQSAAYHIASVLKELKDGHLITVDGKQNVTITDVGLMRLAAGMF